MLGLRFAHPAPDFTLPATVGETITLSAYRGQQDVVLAFYCYDWGRI